MSERLLERIKNIWRDDLVNPQALDAEHHYSVEAAADQMRVDLLARALDYKTQWEHYLVADPFATATIDAEYRARLGTLNEALDALRTIAPSVDAHLDIEDFHKSVHESASESIEGGCASGFETEQLERDLLAYINSGHQAANTAELLIAKHLLEAMTSPRENRSPGDRIDLSQKYATNDQSAANERHQIAIQNLEPFIQRAEDLGYDIQRGQGLTPARIGESIELGKLAYTGHSIGVASGI